MSGRDPDAPIPADFRCDWAEPGQRACPAWRCDCFVATHPDDPFGLHPEDFLVFGHRFDLNGHMADCPRCVAPPGKGTP